jgi:exodeoxyribonuclease VIII
MVTLEKLNERPLSYSSLKEFAKSPAHYVEYLRRERKPTPAMAFGSLIHCLLLQPNEFGKQFIVMPNIDRRTKEGKALYESFLAQTEGKEIITEEQYEEANNLINKAIAEPHIADAIQGCNSFEKEWRAEINGLPFRGFFDGEADDYILEVKTANDASHKTIINDFYNRSYHIQAGLYSHISGKPIKYLLIETNAPYNISLADVDPSFNQYGITQAVKLIEDFKSCMENNMFNMGYEYHSQGNFTITLPSWIK